MGEIEYKVHTAKTIDDKIAEDIFGLVSRTLGHLNTAYRNNAYTTEGLNAFLGRYRPIRTEKAIQGEPTKKEMVTELPFTSVTSVLVYDNNTLIGIGFLVDGSLSQRRRNMLPQFEPKEKSATLYGIYADPKPKYRGQGIESRILQEILKHAKDSGIEIVQAIATKFPSDLEFYKRHGFKEPKKVEFRYGGHPMEFHELQLVLSQQN